MIILNILKQLRKRSCLIINFFNKITNYDFINKRKRVKFEIF